MKIISLRFLVTRAHPVLAILLLFVLLQARTLPASEPESPPAAVEPALELIHALGCKACHSIQDDGGSLAPDLTRIGSRLTTQQIQQRLTRHNDSDSSTFMPDYSNVAPTKLERISRYLYELR